MKGILIFLLFLIGFNTYGQKITGTVTDKSTKLPVSGAIISSSVAKALTNSLGEFEIRTSGGIDTLKIFHENYSTYSLPIVAGGLNIKIELDLQNIILNTVTIFSARDLKRDSLNNRKEYEKEFNYKAPRLRDAFSGSSVSPSMIFAALTKKRSSEYKLREILVEDEKEQFVTRNFSPSIVSSITGLKGDELKRFLQLYRPDYEFVKTTTQYDLITYIKDSYKHFIVMEAETPPIKLSSPAN